MMEPLGVRLVAEALGTFMFFFLGFCGIAVAVDYGQEAIQPVGHRRRASGSDSSSRSPPSATSPGATTTPA